MEDIVQVLKAHGPLTGKELQEKTNLTIFDLWFICNQNPDLALITVGKKYLRLDKHVEGYARLSPSIIREFSNYTLVSLKEQKDEAGVLAEGLYQSIIGISKAKFELAKDIMEKIIEAQDEPQVLREKVCFIIAGDVAYGMAHLEPRAEFSTGIMVRGSDLDIVVIHEDLRSEDVKKLDSTIYEWKYYLLKHPNYREEIDYILKDLSTVEKQLAFDRFETMVAAKVLAEGEFLSGSPALFAKVKKMILEHGITEKLEALTAKSHEEREKARELLLKQKSFLKDPVIKHLFYTTEEREEFF